MKTEKEEPTLQEAWGIFKNAVSYLKDSRQGKIDIETYMRNLSPAVDGWILRYEKENQAEFRDGFCEVKREGDDTVFLITLRFCHADGSQTEKRLRKRKPAEDFIGDASERVKTETLRYEIESPHREG